ncbi:tetratricopeptide repeat protein [uncultured Roseovarius sp.]|uniref:tetratricopeptide repeat protein n=1 Tax=uncultured Roseovarius sp. TaxID=293344 RepID=UPI00262FCC8A|nr:tetratricopeptide repeat protein [uncultured Roseovarius sp.]
MTRAISLILLAASIWVWTPLDSSAAAEATCGANRDSICVTEKVPEVDVERAWKLLRGNVKFSFEFFKCLGGNQLSCTIVGGEFSADRHLPYDLTLSAAILAPTCDAGHEIACSVVAEYLMKNDPAPTDHDLIADLSQRACRVDPQFCEAHAYLYFGDSIFPEDFEKVVEILHFACERDAAQSCYLLGLVHGEGLTADSDDVKAVAALEKSCDMLLVTGCLELAIYYNDTASKVADRVLALENFKKSCALADGEGCFNAGLLTGHEAAPEDADFDAALMLHERGCELGNTDSCMRVAFLYSSSLISDPDIVTSFEFQKKACELGEMDGCGNVGYHYEYGQGVEKNGKLADEAYRYACENGSGGGCNGLGNIYAKGMAGTQDDFRAVELFEKACEMGDAMGCANVAYFGEEQRGVFRLDHEIAAFYKRGCDGGFQTACDRLIAFENK